MYVPSLLVAFFFFNDTATTEIYTLSLHDALPISSAVEMGSVRGGYALRPKALRHAKGPDVGRAEDLGRGDQHSLAAASTATWQRRRGCADQDRKSTRLNSSHT